MEAGYPPVNVEKYCRAEQSNDFTLILFWPMSLAFSDKAEIQTWKCGNAGAQSRVKISSEEPCLQLSVGSAPFIGFKAILDSRVILSKIFKLSWEAVYMNNATLIRMGD